MLPKFPTIIWTTSPMSRVRTSSTDYHCSTRSSKGICSSRRSDAFHEWKEEVESTCNIIPAADHGEALNFVGQWQGFLVLNVFGCKGRWTSRGLDLGYEFFRMHVCHGSCRLLLRLIGRQRSTCITGCPYRDSEISTGSIVGSTIHLGSSNVLHPSGSHFHVNERLGKF